MFTRDYLVFICSCCFIPKLQYYLHSDHVDLSQNANGIREQMKELSKWMQIHDLSHNRIALFHLSARYLVHLNYSVILSEKQSNLAAIFRNFSESDMKRCISMVDVM